MLYQLEEERKVTENLSKSLELEKRKLDDTNLVNDADDRGDESAIRQESMPWKRCPSYDAMAAPGTAVCGVFVHMNGRMRRRAA